MWIFIVSARVLPGPGGGGALLPRIVPTGGDPEERGTWRRGDGRPVRFHGLESLDGIAVVSLANQAAAFLRNPLLGCRIGEQRESQLVSAPLEVVEKALAVSVLVVRRARVHVLMPNRRAL